MELYNNHEFEPRRGCYFRGMEKTDVLTKPSWANQRHNLRIPCDSP